MNSFIYKKINMTSKPTIGGDFYHKCVALSASDTVNLQMWDTAGQERFQSLCRGFYRGIDCCVLVYDVTDSHTFQNLEKWQQDFIATASKVDVPFVILGNKLDKGKKFNTSLVDT